MHTVGTWCRNWQWMNTSFKNVLYKQRVLKIRETWNRKTDLICGGIRMADLLLMFMLMNAYHKTIPNSSMYLLYVPQGSVWQQKTICGTKLRWMYGCSNSFEHFLSSVALSDIKTCSFETSATIQKQTGWYMRKQTGSCWGDKQVGRQVERPTYRRASKQCQMHTHKLHTHLHPGHAASLANFFSSNSIWTWDK